jgi:hypothetical protein
MLPLQIISYTEVTHLENEEEKGSQGSRLSEDTSCVSSSSLAMQKSQSNFEGMFLKVTNTKDTSLLTEGSQVKHMDTGSVDNCDMVMPGRVTSRKDGENTSYVKTIGRTSVCVQDGAATGLQSPGEGPNKSLKTCLPNDIELKDSAVTGNLCSVVSEGNTLSDELRNVSVSCRTSDFLQDSINVSDSVDAERCFIRGSSVVPEGMTKAEEADESIKEDVDYREKTSNVDVTFDSNAEYSSDSDVVDKTKDKKRTQNSVKFMSYNVAHRKCGLILCDFPTVSNSLFKRVEIVNDGIFFLH